MISGTRLLGSRPGLQEVPLLVNRYGFTYAPCRELLYEADRRHPAFDRMVEHFLRMVWRNF